MELPHRFVERSKDLLGHEYMAFERSLSENPPVSIRLNTSKYHRDIFSAERVKWSDSGYYLPTRPTYTFDPLFHAGCYYPQEASSMFIEQVVRQFINKDVRVLDLCAAPGGKSTHLLSLLSKDSLLVSNEVIRARANILSENMIKWGQPNVIVTNNDPQEIGKINNYFDVIVVDAPCSGEGMFRKDRAATEEWSEANIRLCMERQRRILADIWPALKQGGILIYSTCTYNTEENEDNVQWLSNNMQAEPVKLNIPKEWNISGTLKNDLPVYRFFPHKVKGEGFFISVLRKNNNDKIPFTRDKLNKKGCVNTTTGIFSDYLTEKNEFKYIDRKGSFTAIPASINDDYKFISSRLKVISAGIHIGTTKGKDFIPDQSLLLSVYLNKQAFTVFEVDLHMAISFLKRESLVFPPEKPKGYVLLTYENIPIGFVKNIGNRANNHYPQEWRIKQSYIPDILLTINDILR